MSPDASNAQRSPRDAAAAAGFSILACVRELGSGNETTSVGPSQPARREEQWDQRAVVSARPRPSSLKAPIASGRLERGGCRRRTSRNDPTSAQRNLKSPEMRLSRTTPTHSGGADRVGSRRPGHPVAGI